MRNSNYHTFTYGNGTIDTTYVTLWNATAVVWWTYGKIALVYMHDIVLKSGYLTDGTSRICTGVPIPKATTAFNCVGMKPVTQEPMFTRLAVDVYGHIYPTYYGTTQEVVITSTFMYFTN